MLQVGAYNKLPYYKVVGQPQSFYVWVNEDGNGSNTKWLTGASAFTLYNKFRAIKTRKEFIALAKQVHKDNT